jgi:DNA-binding NarL/FixJ family response regulator
MPDLNGLEATRKIRKLLPKTGIVVFSFHFIDQLVREVVDAGAQAYVLKSDAHQDLLIAVEALAKGRSFFTRRAAKLIIDGASEKGSSTPLMWKALLRVNGRLYNFWQKAKAAKRSPPRSGSLSRPQKRIVLILCVS